MNGTTQSRLEAFLPVTNASRVNTNLWREELPTASTTPLENHARRVYVMCGVVGSGKSTLAVQWEALYPDHYVRVNQDALGDRRKCEALTTESLLQGKSPIIDRQNFDASQRYHWLRIGHEAGVEVVALVFHTSKKACADRLILRRGHETVKTPEQGLQVLESMTSIFTRPSVAEGFHRIVDLPAGLPLHYILADINAILAKVAQSELLPAILADPPETSFRGGSWQRGGASTRGRGSGRGRGRTFERDPEAQATSRNAMSHWLSARHGPPSSPPGPSPEQARYGSWSTRGQARTTQTYASQAGRQASRPYTREAHPTTSKTRQGAFPAVKASAGTAFIDVSSDEEG